MTLILQQILFLLLVYFISSIPFGLLFGKIFANTDLRKHGSGNIGATNATRVLGKKLGLLTLILDGAKGGLMVIVARFGFSDIQNLHLYLIIVAFVAIIGHIYPIYLNFKGGKGVATALATILALNFTSGLLALCFWILTFVFCRISAVASLVAIFSTIVTAYFYNAPNEELILNSLIFAVILSRHKENITRIIIGEEKKL